MDLLCINFGKNTKLALSVGYEWLTEDRHKQQTGILTQRVLGDRAIGN
jgi:hypothetical protein